MPPNTCVCRVCLATDARLVSIAGTPLQLVYETLTRASLVPSPRWPAGVCCVCRAQLGNAYRLMLKATRAHDLVEAVLEKQLRMTEKSASLIDRQAEGLHWSLRVCKVACCDSLTPGQVKIEREDDVSEAEGQESEGPVEAPATGPPARSLASYIKYEDSEDEEHNEPLSLLERPVEARNDATIEREVEEDLPMHSEDTVREGDGAREERKVDRARQEGVSSGEKPTDCQRSFIQTKILKLVEQKDDDTDSTHPSRGDSNAQNVQPAYECNNCPRSFSQILDLRSHLKTHADDQPYESDICQRRFQYQSDIKSHRNTHFGNRSPECHVCQRRFPSKQEFKRHLVVHSRTKVFECNTCRRQFQHKNSLIYHLKTHTVEKPYECNICQYKFRDKKCLKCHLKIHTGEKPHKCNVCQRRFLRKSSLNIHLKTHTGEKPYECNICQRWFSLKKTLNIHLKIHTGEKPYECNVCQRRFAQKDSLNKHLKTHTGEKPYECNVCQRRFSEKCSLNRHLKTHTGEKPHKCHVCQLRFLKKESLKRHLNIHTGEKPYECNVCQKRFIAKDNLNKHLKIHTS